MDENTLSPTIDRYTVKQSLAPNGTGPWYVLEASPIGLATVCDCAFESQARRVAAGLALLDACGKAISHGLVIDGTGAANAPAIVHALRFAAGRAEGHQS